MVYIPQAYVPGQPSNTDPSNRPSQQPASGNAYAPQPQNSTGAYVANSAVYVPGQQTTAPSAPSAPTYGYAPAPAVASSAYAPAPASAVASSAYAPAPAASAYAPAPAPASSSAYAPSSSAYAPAPTAAATSVYAPAPASSAAYNPAAASSAYKPASASSAYQPAPVSSAYKPASAAPAPAPLPGFSQALDLPPPSQQQQQQHAPTQEKAPQIIQGTYASGPRQDGGTYSAGASTGYGGGYNTGNKDTYGAVSSSTNINSSVYTGGPTHGLVSEGTPKHCHKLDYELKGNDMQLVEIELDPSETVIAEAGAMMFLEDGIDFKAKFGDGSSPKQGFWKKLTSAGGRLLTGESLFLTHFTNQGQGKARVAFAAPFPGTILPINMANIGEQLICQKDAFLCAALGTRLTIHLNKKIGSGLFGGEGFILQKLKGDGMAFIHAGGTIIKKELRGERLRVDTGCLVAYTDGINCDIQLVPGLKSIFFGGEGLFLATMQGHGTVWLQSLPFSRMADRIVQHAPSIGGQRQGEGSALTGVFGDILNGDGF